MKSFASLFILMLAASFAAWPAANPAVGRWECTATPTGGEQIKLALTVREEAGKLAGSLIMEGGEELTMVEPKTAGKDFSFKVTINGQLYTVESRIDGNQLSGKYVGQEASGTLAGTRKNAGS